MKKFICLIISAFIVTTNFTACSTETNTEVQEESVSTENVTDVTALTEKEEEEVVSQLQESYPDYEITTEDGAIVVDPFGDSRGNSTVSDDEVVVVERGQLDSETTLINSHLGVSMTIPQDWYVTQISNYNFNQNPFVTLDPNDLTVFQINEYRSMLDMVEIGTHEYRADDPNYFAILYNGEIYTDNMTFEEYIDDLRERVIGIYPGELVVEMDETVDIQGKEYYAIGFKDEENEVPFGYRLYIAEHDNYFMAFTFFYWLTHPDPQAFIDDFLVNNISYDIN